MSYDPQNSVLGKLIGVDLNSTSDQAIDISSSKYIIRKFIVTNASATPSVAVGGVYTGAGKTGDQVVSAAQAYTSLSATANFLDASLGSAMGLKTLTGSTIYFALTTAQGSACTADVYVIGDDLGG